MNGILGFAQLLKEPNLTGKEQQEYIRIIEKSGKRMLNIIHDIVDISKIESGQMEVSITETNINDQIEYIYDFFAPEIEKKGLQLFCKKKLPAIESIIKTDREKIYAILTNLVKNAIKYTNEGLIEIGSVKKGNYLEFFVKDTGIGIAKDRQEAIFERFIQADISNKRAHDGAGLGLSIAEAYVEMLGGKIWVASEEGKGSTFYFTIPYNIEPEEKIAVENIIPSGREENQTKNLKILIAEDDEASEQFITRAIRKYSSKILNANTGVEAIAACRNNADIDLILMDIRMPEMNGYEATRQIREFNKDVIIIAQTAYGLSGDRQKALNAGCNDHISKPINGEELMTLIQKYFNK
jgi:CheY-like chemotaxis protein